MDAQSLPKVQMPNRDNFVPMPVWLPNPKKTLGFDARYRGPGFIPLRRLFCWLRESGGNCRGYCNGPCIF